METAPMVGTHQAGLHVFEITVKSNDPVEPIKKLYLTADFERVE
ncbi:MAG: hypothetical protein V3S51_05120 [Dehalococcoidia bacterium]